MSAFYNNYVALCNSSGIAPSRAAIEIGLSKTAVNGWKTGRSNPTDATAQKIADYFGVPVSELYEDKKETPTLSKEDERKNIMDLLDTLSQAELIELMAKTAEKLKERGLG